MSITDWVKKLWPELLVVIGIIMEFAIKKLTAIEQSNEKTTVTGLLLAVMVALFARHFKGGATPASNEPPPPDQPQSQKQQGTNPHMGGTRRP